MTIISLSRADFLGAISAVAKVVERRNTIPILSNVLIEARQGRLAFVATDLDIAARTTIAADIDRDGALTLPAATLVELARKLPDKARIELAFEEGAATLKSGRSRFKLMALPAADFPSFDEGDPAATFTLPSEALSTALARTSFAISSEETRYYLNGIFLSAWEGPGSGGVGGAAPERERPALRFVATDGHRLARYELPLPEGASGMPPVIVPRKTTAELARLLKGHDGPVEIAVNTGKIAFGVGPTRLVSKLIEGTFPDYERILPKGNEHLVTVDREALADALARVTTIESGRGNGVKFSAAEGALKLSVTNADAGTAEEEIEARIEGEPPEIGFNGRYVAEILSVCLRARVSLRLGDPGAPALILDEGEAAALVVLMPLRL